MSRNGEVTLDWADGEYRFRLGLGGIEELQEKTGRGPYVILQRLISGEWFIAELREPIRLGLIGGGLEPAKATALVKRYFDERPPLENMATAKAIMAAYLMGAPDGEKPGKAGAARAGGRKSKTLTEESPLPPSTEQPLQ